MAGLTPYPDEGYSPLRLNDGSAPDPEEEKRNIRSAFDEMALVDEASNLAANDFNVDISDDTSPDAAPAEGYKAPETIEDWEKAIYHASSQLEAYCKSLDQYVNDTRSIIPVDRASAAQVKARAKQIAIARRDYAKMQESITQQWRHINEAKDAQFSANLQAELNDTYASQIKAMAGKGLGAIGWLIEHSPLAGMVETLGGVASYGAQRLGQMLDNKFADSGVNEGTALEQLRDSPVSPSTWVAATGIMPDSDVRKRGREFFKKAGQALGSFEKEVILSTPVWRELHQWNPVALTIRRPVQSAIEGAQVLGNPQTDISRFEFQQATQTQKEQARDLFYEMALMTAVDPLNVVDLGGAALTRLGKLRKLAAINEGALETAARIKAIERVPGMAEKLGGLDKAVDATRGALATDLLKAGMTSDEASNAAKLYDQLYKDGYKEMRALAAADPRTWATNTDELLAKLKGGEGVKAQRDALKQVGDFEVGPTKVFGKYVSDGSKVDPIIGRTFREQAILGQRMKVWKAMYERFGDKPWFKAMGKPWAMLTGHSLLHDIGDNPELLDAYFAQRMFKADAGAEFLRFQQDVMERDAGVLNKFNETQRAEILKALPRAVEYISPEGRAALREGLDANAPLKRAILDLADSYDESAETLRTIQNRFNLDVADFTGPHNYFGREFSEEMQQWLATNPKARGYLFADSTRTSKGFLSTAEVPEEKARKLRDLDFEASEAQLREKFKAYGLPDNVPIWSKDSFGVLKDRAQRAMHKAELRNLYDNFIEAQAGKLDDATRTAMHAEVQKLLREHEAAKQAAFEQAGQAYAKAAQDQQAFREGRKAVRAEQRAVERELPKDAAQLEKTAERNIASEAKRVEFAQEQAAKGRSAEFDIQRRQDKAALAGEAGGLASPRLQETARGMQDAYTELKHIFTRMERPDSPPMVRNAASKARAAFNQFEKRVQKFEATLAKGRGGWSNIDYEFLSKSIPEYRKAFDDLRRALKDAAPSGMVREYGNQATRAERLADYGQKQIARHFDAYEAAYFKLMQRGDEHLARLGAAQGAVAKPVAQAVNAQTRKAASEFKQAAEAARKGDPANWSPKAKAEWILGRLKDPRNLVHALAPAEGEISALEVLLKNKVDVPESWDELARLAATNITPDAEREFGRLATGMYWKQLDKPHKFFALYDALKGFYQKQVLARLGSVAGDVRGTTINGVMAGLAPADLERATRHVGAFTDWQAGKLASANARRLRSEGVLMTRALDTEQDASRLGEAIAHLLPDSKRAQKLGELASKVEKKGFVGATLDALGLKGAGKAAEKYRNAILDYRNYVEDLNRVATYEKAISSGMSHRAAVEEVYKYWGKFDELSKLEAKGLNRIMFFWTWRARSIPVAVRHIFEHPVRSKWLLSMAAGNVDEKDKTPAWLRRMGGYVLGQGEDGGVKAINVGGSTYFDPLKSMLQGDFANMMLHGQPVAAVDGALNDFVRTLPPMLQAPIEYATKYDYFASKPWWRDANQTESNAKAPAFLWWFYTDKDASPVHTAVTDLLDLKPIVGKDGKALGLTMNPRWAWLFGSLPGADAHATDASAFFRAPADSKAIPRLAPIKGVMRQAGFPVYDVQLDDAKDQTRDFKDALIKDAASLSGGSLKADAGGIYPSTTTWRGQEIRKFLEDRAKDFKQQGLTDSQAREKAFDLMRLKYPQEWRVMGLFKRVQAWEQYLIRIEEGGAEISKQQQDEALLLARRMDARRDRNAKLEEKAALK